MNPLLNLYMRQRAANGGRIGFMLGGDYAAEREGTGAYGKGSKGMKDSKGRDIRDRKPDTKKEKKTISEKIASKFDDAYTNLGRVGSLSPTLQALSTGFDMFNTDYSEDPTTGTLNVAIGNSSGAEITTGHRNTVVGANTHLENQTGIGNRPGAQNLLASQQAAQAALPVADPFLSQISEDQAGMYNQLQSMGYSPEYAPQYVNMLG